MNTHSNGKICFADFEIDTAHRLLTRRGQTVALNAKAFDVLEFLAENAGRVVTKNEILDAVWADQFVEEANLKVQISTLRKALGEQKDEHRFLVTLPGKGYKFVADIRNGSAEMVIEKRKVSHLVVEHETEFTDDSTPKATRPASRLILAGAILAGVIIVVAIGAWWITRTSDSKQSNAISLPTGDPELKRLTNQGKVNRVKLSPNGKFFAYTVRQRGSYQTELRLGQTDGASDVLLRSADGLSQYPISFSADGASLYYVEIPAINEYRNSNGAFFKAPVLPGVPQKLSDSGSIFAVLSPDEKHVAFPRNTADRASIVIADVNGAGEREIASRDTEQFIDRESLSWSADGRSIAFGAATGTSKKNSSVRTYEVFVVDAESGETKQLTSLDWNGVLLLEWLKDGTGLVSVARNSEQLNSSSLWLIEYPTGNVRRLSRDVNRYAGALSVSADSKALAVVQSQIETNIWLAPSDDLSRFEQITFSSSGRQDGWHGIDLSSDGRIVYTAWIDESLTIWISEEDGTKARQLTSIGFRDEKPVFTADASAIVFQSNRSGANEIWRIDIDGSNLRQLTTDGGNTVPSVTPDNAWVVYRHAKSTDEDGSLRRVPLAGGEAQVINDTNVVLPQISPDGKSIACGETVDGKTMLAIYSIDGGTRLKMFKVPVTYSFRFGRIRWSPDGQAVTYPDGANGIWRQEMNGGTPARLEGLPAEQINTYSWSHDGKKFVFGRHREVRDVVLISNFR